MSIKYEILMKFLHKKESCTKCTEDTSYEMCDIIFINNK